MNISQPAPLSLARRWTILQLETKTELVKTFRTPAFVIPALLFPVMFYVFFGLLFNAIGGHPGNAAKYMMATYAVFGGIGPALFSFGADVASDKDKGILSLKLVSPMPVSSYFAARIFTAMLFALIIIMSLFTLGAVFGEVTMTHQQWFLTLVTVLSGTLPFCAMGLFIGLSVSAKAAPAIVNIVYLPMAFLSGLWVPIHLFPASLEMLANVFPAYHLAQLTLAIQGNDSGAPWYLHVAALVAYTLIFLGLSVKQFKRVDNRH
ncbi:ABC transporter permease [Alteromonas lipolytica]|uniref:Transport permease protein n=1 Tax=Alteromonas lipolytica TaxID=1856405 RepID=A0A1E8FBQ8_9ALTE|nr:ABC transporter permease [Alteromonas lipolytica]OFI33367.1 hypothetical protein BFC17_03645 [Alteromonas lipolytica]GGF60340.1 ABC transporter [Alteromonas lipolytica]